MSRDPGIELMTGLRALIAISADEPIKWEFTPKNMISIGELTIEVGHVAWCEAPIEAIRFLVKHRKEQAEAQDGQG